MQAFARLYAELDETTKTNEKVDALARYFAAAPPADAAWALYFLSGRKIRQVLGTAKLRAWALEATGLPEWLFGEAYDAVGDFAETVALLLPGADGEQSTANGESPSTLAEWVEKRLLPLRNADEETQRAGLFAAWQELDSRERFIWNKLITGGFRVGVSQSLVTRSLARNSAIPAAVVAHRLMGEWQPTPEFYARLLSPETADADASQPYPFFLASPLESDPAVTLGERTAWQVEWKWDGIRAQLVRRDGQSFVWSRGEELVSDRFPELAAAAALLPNGTVIDGEILPWSGDVLPFAQLQQRLGRKNVTKKMLGEIPVVLLAYDLLELNSQDVRTQPLTWRRAKLGQLVQTINDPTAPIRLSPIVPADDWDALAQLRDTSREQNVEGLMIKRLDSTYGVGRTRGDWWKWKIAPYTVDAVLIYAQRGSGKRASLYSDYTFAVWDAGALVPFAKAYSGLTDAEIRRVDAFVRRNTVEKFGPVRTVKPELVFELAFEGIQVSSRHKSGLAVRFPRMLRWRTDKRPEDADTLEAVRAMLPTF